MWPVHPLQLSFSYSPSAFLSLVHVIQFSEFNDEPSKKHYSLNACTTHYTLYMYLYLYIDRNTYGTECACASVFQCWCLYFCHFELRQLSHLKLRFWAYFKWCVFHFMHHKNLVHSKLSPKFHTVCFMCLNFSEHNLEIVSRMCHYHFHRLLLLFILSRAFSDVNRVKGMSKALSLDVYVLWNFYRRYCYVKTGWKLLWMCKALQRTYQHKIQCSTFQKFVWFCIHFPADDCWHLHYDTFLEVQLLVFN